MRFGHIEPGGYSTLAEWEDSAPTTRVGERTVELRSLNAQLEELALTDSLTGLPNRRAFVDAARREFARSRRHHRPLVVAICDVDHFKSVNDTFGHPIGDMVLRRVAEVMRRSTRTSEMVARYGGEEFVFLIPETTLAGAVALMERIRQTVKSEEVETGKGPVRITASFGVALLEDADSDLDQTLRRADRALYEAKDGGRDRVVAAGRAVVGIDPAKTA